MRKGGGKGKERVWRKYDAPSAAIGMQAVVVLSRCERLVARLKTMGEGGSRTIDIIP